MIQTPRKVRQGGFALVVTLSLMILLTVIAVGLLSISTISLRTSSQSSALTIARSNARLGMMLALGELQKNLGPDTSVSAPASSIIKDAGRPHVVGAWQRPTESTGWPKWHWVPKAGSTPDYAGKKDLFKGWLVSTADIDDAQDLSLPQSNITPGTNVITLVGNVEKNLKNNGVSNVVNADKIKVGTSTRLGKFAWSVSDESTKAPINLATPAAQSIAQEIAGRSAPSRVRADLISTKLEQALKEPKNLVSLETAIIPGGDSTQDDIRVRYHDFTTNSLGLLTDTASGGLKTDLTSIFEDSGTAASTGAFTSPNIDSPYDDTFAVITGKPKWSYLRDVYRKYKLVTPTDRGPAYTPAAATDLKIDGLQYKRDPEVQRLLPVIAKVQLIFSVVTHIEHINRRKDFYNKFGTPAGNDFYAVPHLVYDPIVTLYNPYDVALDLERLSIRIWDPPVGFRFTKVTKSPASQVLFRPSGGVDGFFGIANFQGANENDAKARKTFTLALTDGTSAAAGASLKLLPGEVRVFSPRVEDDWNWAKETRGQFDPYAFFDHKSDWNFGNVDFRTYAGGSGPGAYGLETVPGWRGQAGLSVDHLSFGGRPESTMYDFERNRTADWRGNNEVLGGYIPIKITDSVKVEAKAMIARGSNASAKSFQVDILAGKEKTSLTTDELKSDSVATNVKVSKDRIRSFSFLFADVTNEMLEPDAPTIIERTYQVGSILQRATEPKIPGTNIDGPGGKKMFAVLEMSARATADPITDSKPWLYNNPLVEGADQTTTTVGLANQSYDLRLRELFGGFKAFPDGVDIDLPTGRGYFGASSSSGEGSSFVQMMHVPALPMASLGDLIHTNLVSSSTLPRVVHPLGNSYAHPLIATNAVSKVLGTTMLDHTYLLNDGLWDKYYFSSITGYGSGNGSALIAESRNREEVLEGVLGKSKPALNDRLVPVSSSGSPKDLAKTLDEKTTLEISKELAANLAVSGPFNLSSTSVDAWISVLSSLRDRVINRDKLTGQTTNPTTYNNNSETPFVRMTKPLAGADAVNNIRWAGYRSLSDDEIKDLATKIVLEIVNRGVQDKAPAFSVAEFVNRRIGSESDVHVLKGILQTAIDETNINKEYLEDDGNEVTAAGITAVRKKGASNLDSMTGNTGEGTPSILTQGDLMKALAPIATVRGDTFKIRSYGEATDPTGTKILARAWCEVVVQRVPEYVDSTDVPTTATAVLKSSLNIAFGRRFNVVSFRWLNEKEI